MTIKKVLNEFIYSSVLMPTKTRNGANGITPHKVTSSSITVTLVKRKLKKMVLPLEEEEEEEYVKPLVRKLKKQFQELLKESVEEDAKMLVSPFKKNAIKVSSDAEILR